MRRRFVKEKFCIMCKKKLPVWRARVERTKTCSLRCSIAYSHRDNRTEQVSESIKEKVKKFLKDKSLIPMDDIYKYFDNYHPTYVCRAIRNLESDGFLIRHKVSGTRIKKYYIEVNENEGM